MVVMWLMEERLRDERAASSSARAETWFNQI